MTLAEAERAWKRASWRDYIESMAGSRYVVERRGRDYCLAHYVAGDKVSEDWGGGRVLRGEFEAEPGSVP